jgi:hypothetical protein
VGNSGIHLSFLCISDHLGNIGARKSKVILGRRRETMSWGNIRAGLPKHANVAVYKFSARVAYVATVTRDHICDGTAGAMWREERLERVGVLQKVRLTNIVLF